PQRAAGVLDFLKDVSAGHVSLLGGRFRLRGRSSGSRGASLRPRVELVARALGLRVVSVAAQTGSGARLGSEPVDAVAECVEELWRRFAVTLTPQREDGVPLAVGCRSAVGSRPHLGPRLRRGRLVPGSVVARGQVVPDRVGARVAHVLVLCGLDDRATVLVTGALERPATVPVHGPADRIDAGTYTAGR